KGKGKAVSRKDSASAEKDSKDKGKGKAVSRQDSASEEKDSKDKAAPVEEVTEQMQTLLLNADAQPGPSAGPVPPPPKTQRKQYVKAPITWGSFYRITDPGAFNVPPMVAMLIDRTWTERYKLFNQCFIPEDSRGLPGEGFAVRIPQDVNQVDLFRSGTLISLANSEIDQALQIAWLDWDGETYLLCFKKNLKDSLFVLADAYCKVWVMLGQYRRHLTFQPANEHMPLHTWLNTSSQNYSVATMAIWNLALNRQAMDDKNWLAQNAETRRRIEDIREKLGNSARMILLQTRERPNLRETRLNDLLFDGAHTKDRSLTFDQAMSAIKDQYESFEEDGCAAAAGVWMYAKYREKAGHPSKFAVDKNDSGTLTPGEQAAKFMSAGFVDPERSSPAWWSDEDM
ncbi:hypothetical protein KHU50_010091, partial [Colletotrichum sp. SAR 10_65]